MSRHRIHSILAATAVALAGCAEPPLAPDPDTQSFAVAVTGADAHEFTGKPVFTADHVSPAYGFAVAMVEATDQSSTPGIKHAVYLHRAQTTPTVGEYPVDASGSQFSGGVVLDGDTSSPIFCVAESGTVQIIKATTESVRGKFTMVATCSRHKGLPLMQPLSVSGEFIAEAGNVMLPDVTQEMRPIGRFQLAAANDRALPAKVFDGIVLEDEDTFFRLEVSATSGYLDIAENGRYEHRLVHDIRIDGQRGPGGNWVDRGQCTWARARLTCVSGLKQNVTFIAVPVGQQLQITQDIVGEGQAVSYRYSW